MTIEFVPRSRREEDGWRDHASAEDRAAEAKVPRVATDELDGVQGVRVPVQGRGFVRPRMFFARPWVFFIVMINGGNILRGINEQRSHLGWSIWAGLLVMLVLLVLLYRALRLHPFTGRDRPDLFLTPLGIHTRGLVVPWSEINEVVRFHFLFGPGRGGPGARNFVAVRVGDFVSVRGLSPFRAGLANLTRRHLIVLALAVELHEPDALAAALETLVHQPERRAELGTFAGEQLVRTGR